MASYCLGTTRGQGREDGQLEDGVHLPPEQSTGKSEEVFRISGGGCGAGDEEHGKDVTGSVGSPPEGTQPTEGAAETAEGGADGLSDGQDHGREETNPEWTESDETDRRVGRGTVGEQYAPGRPAEMEETTGKGHGGEDHHGEALHCGGLLYLLGKRENLQKITDLQEQLNDLMLHFEAQAKLQEQIDKGNIEADVSYPEGQK